MNSSRILKLLTLFRASNRNIFTNISLFESNKPDLKISEKCVERLKQINPDGNSFLRITIDGGGCSGFQYRFDLDSQINDDDECFQKDGVKIIVDKMSIPFIEGSTIDYHEEMIRSSFRIIDNPNADSKCSCGASFAIKMP